jgi:hypothetical protein
LVLICQWGNSKERPKSVSPGSRQCWKISLNGEVQAGEKWSQPLGDGWIFKVLPIAPSGRGFTGWDLVLDREQESGYPDALLLATPPYDSLSEREIGTTFGLRAQDAIAWQPRRFHFLTSPEDLSKGRKLFHALMTGNSSSAQAQAQARAGIELLRLVSGEVSLGTGEFEIVDAKLTPGESDPPVFAQQWASRLRSVPHTIVPSQGQGSARGELRSIRFEMTLWLPKRWTVVSALEPKTASCAE